MAEENYLQVADPAAGAVVAGDQPAAAEEQGAPQKLFDVVKVTLL